MKFNNFTSSWVESVSIDTDRVIVDTKENKTYVMRDVTLSDKMSLIEAMVDNANGEEVSVGSEIKWLFDIYDAEEMSSPVVDKLSASDDRLIYDGETLAYFEKDKFQYIGPAASSFFNSLRKEISGAKK